MSMDWTGRRVLVTGASGFLGSHLTRRLVHLGASVHVWTGSSANLWRLADVRERVTPAVVDVRDRAQVQAACARSQPEVVYHLAAYGVHAEQQDLQLMVGTNVTGTVHLLDALRQTPCRTVISTGTWAEYGNKSHPIAENEPLEPVGLYGATKAASTLLAMAFSEQTHLPVIVLRPFSVYGPGEGGAKFVPSVIRSCLQGENPRLSSGRQIRDYLYVDDVTGAYLKAAEVQSSRPLVLNVASGVPLRLDDFARAIVRHFPGRTAEFGAIPDRHQEIWTVQADISRATEALHWRPQYSLEDGIRMTIEWFNSNLDYNFKPTDGTFPVGGS